jgi:DTW domain-containing protein YfiP
VPNARTKSIVPDLVDFLKKHIVPLKKGEVVKGSPSRYCLKCGRNVYNCRCHKIRSK